MTIFQEVAEWVKSLIPDLDRRVDTFRVEAVFLDDELMKAVKDEIAEQSARMKSGIDNDDPEEIRLAAHSIKGMGGSVGLPEISVLANEIELRSKQDDLSSCKSLVAEFLAWATRFAEV